MKPRFRELVCKSITVNYKLFDQPLFRYINLTGRPSSTEGPDCPNSLLMHHLRLAHIWRRRMMRNLAFDRHGCVAVVDEVS